MTGPDVVDTHDRDDEAERDEPTAVPPTSLPGRVVATAQGAFRAVDRLQRAKPLLAVPVAVVKKFGDDQAGNLAALVAYYTFFSLFPLLMVFVSILGFLLAGDPAMQDRLVDSALSQFPVVGDQLRTDIGELEGRGVALAVGIVGALWGGLGALDAMQNAMSSVWNVPRVQRPNLIRTRLRGSIMLVALALAVSATSALSALRTAATPLGPAGAAGILVLSLALNAGLYLVAFKVLTDRPLPWAALVPGAVVAGVAFTVLQAVGGWYVTRVLNGAGDVFGTFAVVLGLLSWLYLLAQLTVLAAEVNVVLHRRLWPRSLTGEALTAADHVALRQYASVEERIPDSTVHLDLPALDPEASP